MMTNGVVWGPDAVSPDANDGAGPPKGSEGFFLPAKPRQRGVAALRQADEATRAGKRTAGIGGMEPEAASLEG